MVAGERNSCCDEAEHDRRAGPTEDDKPRQSATEAERRDDRDELERADAVEACPGEPDPRVIDSRPITRALSGLVQRERAVEQVRAGAGESG